jgi:hypothetical protein
MQNNELNRWAGKDQLLIGWLITRFSMLNIPQQTSLV